MKRSKGWTVLLLFWGVGGSASGMLYPSDSQEKYINEARNLIVYLSENEPKWRNIVDKEGGDLSEDSYLDDEETYTEAEKLYGEIRQKWNRLSVIVERIENSEQKRAIEGLFTPNENDRRYGEVVEVLNKRSQ